MNPANFSQIRAEDLILGRLAIQQQMVAKEEVSALLKEQKDHQERGQVVRLSSLLVNKGLMTQIQIDRLQEIQRKNFMVCHKCFTQFNIEAFPDGKKFKCKNCGTILTVSRVAAPTPPSTPTPPPAAPTTPAGGSEKKESYTFEEVQQYLCIDSKELGLIIASGELKGFLDGAVMKFKGEDVERVKKSKEVQPTMILDNKTGKPAAHPGAAAGDSSGWGLEIESDEDSISDRDRLSMTQVLSLLQIDEAALRKFMALGELIPQVDQQNPDKTWFSQREVNRIKQSREAQPTLILTNDQVTQASLSEEQLVSFEEAMEDLQIDATTLRQAMNDKEIHPIQKGDRTFFKSSDIAGMRSKIRQKSPGKKDTHKLSRPAPSAAGGQDDFLTFEDVLGILNIEAKELRQMVVSKTLPGVHKDGIIKFRPEDVEALKNKGGAATATSAPPAPQAGGGGGIPLLSQIPSTPASQWFSNPEFGNNFVESRLNIPHSGGAQTFAIHNFDPNLFPSSDILVCEIVDLNNFTPDFKNYCLVRVKNTVPPAVKIRKVGDVGGNYMFMNKGEMEPVQIPGNQVDILGRLLLRITNEGL